MNDNIEQAFHAFQDEDILFQSRNNDYKKRLMTEEGFAKCLQTILKQDGRGNKFKNLKELHTYFGVYLDFLK